MSGHFVDNVFQRRLHGNVRRIDIRSTPQGGGRRPEGAGAARGALVRVKRDGTTAGWQGTLDGERVFRTARRCSGTAITIRLGFTSAFEEKRYATAWNGVDRFFPSARQRCRSFHFHFQPGYVCSGDVQGSVYLYLKHRSELFRSKDVLNILLLLSFSSSLSLSVSLPPLWKRESTQYNYN